jgi:MoxR-like ATPase
VRALADSLSLRFSRIPVHADLMPADITGATTLHRDETSGRHELRFRLGPVFANLVLADEVNRGTPKTQSALLEAMQEHAVTISGERRVLEEPFQVIATQNPIEMEGTYPLPEAQLDRFLVKLQVGWPSFEELKRIGLETTGSRNVTVEPVLSRADVLDLQELTREIVVGPTSSTSQRDSRSARIRRTGGPGRRAAASSGSARARVRRRPCSSAGARTRSSRAGAGCRPRTCSRTRRASCASDLPSFEAGHGRREGRRRRGRGVELGRCVKVDRMLLRRLAGLRFGARGLATGKRAGIAARARRGRASISPTSASTASATI